MVTTPVRNVPPSSLHSSVMHEAITCAVLGEAISRTLHILLPRAATTVEAATQDAVSRLHQLAAHSMAQATLIQQMLTYMAGMNDHAALCAQWQEQADALAQDNSQFIDGLVTDLQFQDRNSQLMLHAAHMLDRYAGLLVSLRERALMLQDDGASCEQAGAIADHWLSHVSTGEVRRHFLDALIETGIPLERIPADSDESGGMELF